ncbi:DNA polymerase [Paramuricea clavata]|uniref:DNA-directed RNA polymerase n=1 Tax=Paramuricea clavata TaxID=317549 RepID=A0A6S7JYJ9_PARCT|nr:DNA polymerase [Paramuricea clavata]
MIQVVNNDHEFSKYINDAYKEMPEVYACVNKLQSVPLRVNKKIFEILNTAVTKNIRLECLPDFNFDEYRNSKQQQYDVYQTRLKTTDHDARYFYLLSDFMDANKARALSISRAVKLAKKYLNEPEFYNTMMCDFRGRMYTSSELSFMQHDCTRAMLEFSKGKKLKTKLGVEAFKIHGANLAGKSKESYSDRLKFIDTNEKNILEVVKDPIENKWWIDVAKEKSWQFLAFCFEYKNYKELGTKHISHLPIQIDATASLLQHISMITKDKELAEKTNLIKNEKPYDIYTEILEEAEAILHNEYHEEHAVESEFVYSEQHKKYIKVPTNKFYAGVWSTVKLTRDLIKQAVIGTVFGGGKHTLKTYIFKEF